MKKLAIFVEGQTEQIFVEKLLREIADKISISIEIQSKERRKFAEVIMKDPLTCTTKFYVLIHNSSGDERVASDINENYNSLTNDGYERIIGLRDIYPNKKSDVQKGIDFALKQINIIIPINVVLAVREVEAWFLAEYNHFIKIDSSLTPDKIQENFGFNPKTDDMEERVKPSDDMKNIYNFVGKGYQKSEKKLNTLASHLDYEFIYMELANKVPSLGEFIGYIDKFMAP